ncbi:hypothetical protein [Methyloterricola oryzae]|uniref:hypothetical protein n=1 Tax=Methyloterricola oryzae TaxID=1495050 RepID=UPI0005EB37F1|nr:hypothetical protein [Methyloterricola oryzae]
MNINYFVWEKDGHPKVWSVVEGKAQALGEFTEKLESIQYEKPTDEQLRAELDMVGWCEDQAQLLPDYWRFAKKHEIGIIRQLLSVRIHSKLSNGRRKKFSFTMAV